MKHWHHIIPRHVGGTDEPSNLIELTVEEHAEAHRILWETHGRWQDELAWKLLSKQIGKEDAIVEASRRATANRDNSYLRKPKSAETVAKLSAATKGKKKSPEHVATLRKMYATAEWRKKTVNKVTFIIDGEQVVGLKTWAESHGYPYDSVKTRIHQSGKYKHHTIERVASCY